MGYIADQLTKGEESVAPAPDTLGTSLRKGWSSGLDSLGANANQLAGLAGEAAGADGFAKNRYAAAKTLRESAEMGAPQISSLDQIDGVGNALRYGAGQLGALAPIALGVTGASLATGNPLVGGALAMGVPEAGDIAYRQTQDPGVAGMGAGERLARAGAGGLASGVVQSAGPGMLMGKFAAPGKELVRRSMPAIVGQNLASGVGVNAGASAGSEAIKQIATNTDAPLNTGAIGEAAAAGAVMGLPFGAAGAGVDLVRSSPGKSWIGAKNLAQSGVDAVKGAASTVDPVWQGLGEQVKAGVAFAKEKGSKAMESMPDMPEGVRNAAEFARQSVDDQVASARTAWNELKTADNLPAEVMAQVKEASGKLMDASSRAYLWSVAKTRAGLDAAKKAAPDDLVTKLRDIGKPVTDMADSIMGSQSMADTKEFLGKTTDQVSAALKERAGKTADLSVKLGNDLLSRSGLSDEHQAAIREAMSNAGDTANQIKIATIAKSLKAKDYATEKVSKAYDKVSEAYKKMYRDDLNKQAGDFLKETEGQYGVKKSEDYSGLENLIYEKVAPMIEDAKPEFLENPENINKLGGTLRMFLRAAADGKDLRVAGIHTSISDMLGHDLAHDVLNAAHEYATGGDQAKVSNMMKTLSEQLRDKVSNESLTQIIKKSQSAEAPARTGVTDSPEQLAGIIRDWARGEYSKGKSRSQIEYHDEVMKQFLRQHFGTKADRVLAAAQKEVEGEAKRASGKTEARTDSDERTGDLSEKRNDASDSEYGTTNDREVKTFYHEGKDGENKLYEQSPETVSKHGSALEQALAKQREEHPNHKVHFVKLRDYAKAHDLDEAAMLKLTGGKDPGSYGFIKHDLIDGSDKLEPHQLRKMRGEIRSAIHPDAIGVEGRTIQYDSRRIANVMHESAKDEWTDRENAHGMRGRMAQKFAEGIAKLTEHEGANLKVRDDHVIARINGKDMTWGEAKEILAKTSTIKVTKADANERAHEAAYEDAMKKVPKEKRKDAAKVYERKSSHENEAMNHEYVSELSDKEIKEHQVKVFDAREKRISEIRKEEHEALSGTFRGTTREFSAELKRRIDARTKEEDSRVPAMKRMLDSLEYEASRRSGEDRRAQILDVGMDTRDGIDVTRTRGNDGYKGSSSTIPPEVPLATSFQHHDPMTSVSDLIDHFVAGTKKPERGPSREVPVKESRYDEMDLMEGARDKAASDFADFIKRERQHQNYKETGKAKYAPEVESSSMGSGRTEGDKYNDNIHVAAALFNEESLKLSGNDSRGKVPLLVDHGSQLRSLEKTLKTPDLPRERIKKIQETMATLQAEHGTMTEAGMDMLRMKTDRMKNSAVAATRDLGAKVEALSKIVDQLDPQDQLKLATAMYIDAKNAKQIGGYIGELAKQKGIDVTRTTTPKKPIPENPVRFEDGKVVEGSPNPKAVAAKKAAFLERAASGDEGLIKEVSTSDDAKGLQRAAQALDGKPGPVLDAINARLSELVQDPQTALGMQTKKYSLISNVIHNDLEKPGFAATHDSPLKHAGEFDWRKHLGKGEGNAAYGAGTYLSTKEGVHRSYKEQFTAKATDAALEADPHYQKLLSRGRELSMELGMTLDLVDEARIQEKIYENEAAVEDYLEGKKLKSPTYHVSVNIPKEHLLDWNKSLNQQPKNVRNALNKLGAVFTQKIDIDASIQNLMGGRTTASFEFKGHTYNIEEDISGKLAMDDGKYMTPPWKTEEVLRGVMSADKIVTKPKTGGEIYNALAKDLGSQRDASEYLQELGILGHKYNSVDGTVSKHPNYVIYDDSKISTNYVHFDANKATGTPLTEKGKAQIKKYLHDVLGDSVAVNFPDLAHAGEYADKLISVSVHALNPTTVAYHESLHAFFEQLRDKGLGDSAKVVEQAASKPAVTARLRELLAHSPDALAQLKDAEERAAYMYQFWANGDAKLIAAMGEKPTTLFARLAEGFKKLMGIWTNDQHALHIMEYFSSGEYAKNINDKNAVYKGLDQGGAHAKLKEMGKSFMEMGDAVWGAGSSRLRDSGIPALGELADMIKKKGTAVGRDAGFIPAARIARADFMHKLAEGLGPMEETMMRDAMEALQQGKAATTPEGLKAQAAIRGVLDDVFDYLGKAGVKVNDLGYGKDYFPRHWDSNYLSKHKAEFMAMARKYPDWHNPEDTYNKLIANDGAELRVADRPGFSGKKERVLSFIDHADAAPFMSKNLLATVNGYITQATRRAEWARRFNDDNTGIEGLLVRARKEGASEKDIDHAQKFLAGVNGTLGDDLNPTMRRYMGNMIVYQNVRLLPLAIFSSVVDPMGIAVRGGTVGDAFKTFVRGVKEVPAGLKGKQITDHWTQMAEALGTIDNATLSHSLGALYTQGMVDGTARKINDTFFRFNLMEQFNNSMRVGATEASLKFMAKHATGKASMHSARWMNELGLSRGDIKVDKDGHVLTTVADGLTEAQAARVKRAVNQWVDGAVLRPDAADKPTWMNDPHFMLVSHLKQFVYSFQHTILDRVVHEFKNGNYQPAMAMASYIPIMIAADMLKGFIMGGGSQPGWKAGWGVSDYLESGIERAGLFGVGQFGIDALTGHAGTLVGPTLEQFGQAVAAVQGPKQFAPMVIHALPANALYSGYVRGASVPDPVHSE